GGDVDDEVEVALGELLDARLAQLGALGAPWARRRVEAGPAHAPAHDDPPQDLAVAGADVEDAGAALQAQRADQLVDLVLAERVGEGQAGVDGRRDRVAVHYAACSATAAGSGAPSRKPWARRQPTRSRAASWAGVSTPSATTSSPSARASATTAPSTSSSPATSARSSLTSSTGQSRRSASDAAPAPKSSTASRTPRSASPHTTAARSGVSAASAISR